MGETITIPSEVKILATAKSIAKNGLNVTFYMFSRVYNLEGASQPAGLHPSSIHVRIQAKQRLLPFDPILLAAPPDSAGVGRGTSRLIKPREPDLRNRWRLIFAQSF